MRNIVAALACIFAGHQDVYVEKERQLKLEAKVEYAGDVPQLPEIFCRCGRCGRQSSKEVQRAGEKGRRRRPR